MSARMSNSRERIVLRVVRKRASPFTVGVRRLEGSLEVLVSLLNLESLVLEESGQLGCSLLLLERSLRVVGDVQRDLSELVRVVLDRGADSVANLMSDIATSGSTHVVGERFVVDIGRKIAIRS